MALTYAQLISPIQYPDLPELLPLEKYHHIYDSRSLLAKNFGGRDRAAVAAPRYAAAKGTAGIGAVYAVRGR